MNNNVNVLRQSSLFNDLKSGRAPDLPFVANNVLYKRGYYLTDGIYSQWSVLIKSVKNPGTNDHKRILYKTKHEVARKDVERAFGVLKQKWKIIKYPAQGLTQNRLSDIMYICIILHNMIIHDNGNAISPDFFSEEQHRDDDPVRTHAESMSSHSGKRSHVGCRREKTDVAPEVPADVVGLVNYPCEYGSPLCAIHVVIAHVLGANVVSVGIPYTTQAAVFAKHNGHDACIYCILDGSGLQFKALE
ncbi:ALP1-like protein [Tanacetum coccineum]